MANEIKPIGVDASGFEILTEAVHYILNLYPGLSENDYISFEELEKDSGIAFSADSGALVMSEKRSITDHVKQICQFPFFVVFRTNAKQENQKINVQEFLEKLGKWICQEPVEMKYVTHRLKGFPELSDGRKITRITRQNSYGTEPDADGVQDWLLPVTVQYTHEYDIW